METSNNIKLIILFFAIVISACQSSTTTNKKAVIEPSVFFKNIQNGAVLSSPFIVDMGVDGMEVETIEGLADADGVLHPVQQAFHECHALQCGYCTPGMVMASVSLIKENSSLAEDDVREGLEGNLCRCTGYHNIVKAVLQASETAT